MLTIQFDKSASYDFLGDEGNGVYVSHKLRWCFWGSTISVIVDGQYKMDLSTPLDPQGLEHLIRKMRIEEASGKGASSTLDLREKNTEILVQQWHDKTGPFADVRVDMDGNVLICS